MQVSIVGDILWKPSHRKISTGTSYASASAQAVAAEYQRRRWIQARCDAEKATAQEWLSVMHQAATPDDCMNSARVFLGALSGLLAVAQLKRPTTRRILALLHELLETQGRPALNEAALTAMGSAHLSRTDLPRPAK
jgi:hypothetical protein